MTNELGSSVTQYVCSVKKWIDNIKILESESTNKKKLWQYSGANEPFFSPRAMIALTRDEMIELKPFIISIYWRTTCVEQDILNKGDNFELMTCLLLPI